MSAIIKPRMPKINWAHPLTRGLVVDIPFYLRGETTVKDLATRLSFSPTGTLSKSMGLYGTELYFGGDAKVQNSTMPSTVNSLGLHSMMVILRPDNFTSGASFPRMMVKGDGTQTVGYFEMAADATHLTHAVKYSTGTNSRQVDPPALNKWHVIIMTGDNSLTAANQKIYINGVEPGTYTSSIDGTGTLTPDGTYLTIGNRMSDAGRGFQGYISVARVWKRKLNAGEIADLFENPWQIYRSHLTMLTRL